MPFAFIIIGLVLLVSGVKGTTDSLTTLVKGDFTGQNSYIRWMFAILVIGALGYIKQIEPISRMFLVLVVIVLFVSNKGVFASFNSQLFSPVNGKQPTLFDAFNAQLFAGTSPSSPSNTTK